MQANASQRKRLLRSLTIGGCAAVVALAITFLPGFLESFELRTWDMRVRAMAGPGVATEDVAVILLDQQSLDWAEATYGLSWPWPREVYSLIVNFSKRAEVKSLAFDVLFTEPSVYGVQDDETLALAAVDFQGFVAALFLGNETGDATQWPANAAEPLASVQPVAAGSRRLAALANTYQRAAFPIAPLLASGASLANVSSVPDVDGVFRRTFLFSQFDSRLVPALSVASFLVAHPEDVTVRVDERRVEIGGRRLRPDAEGRAIINYRGPSGTHATYAAAGIIQSETNLLAGQEPSIDPDVLSGKHVFFGFSAPGLFDLRPTAVAPVYTGVEIHATVLDNLLSNDFISEAPAIVYRILIALMAFLCGMTVVLTSGGVKNVVASIGFLVLPIIVGVGFFLVDVWFPIAEPTAAILLTLIAAGIANYLTEGRQKRFIQGAFGQYLSPTVIERLIDNPEQLKLGGERRELSMFFSDIEGFTTISEDLSPESLTSLLNDYLSHMTDIILEEGGTIDKYEGDAIIAFWNAPLEQSDHANRVVAAALRCQISLAEMQPELRQRTGSDAVVRMRIGINSGPAVVGNLGSRVRFDYTMLGDAVNLASRLEGINKQFGTYTLITAHTFDALGGAVPAREISRVAVVGRHEPVTVYEPMLKAVYDGRRTVIDAFDSGLRAYYAGDFGAAGQIFAGIEAHDPPARAYRKRCVELSDAAPDQWDGIWTMTQK